MFKIIGALIVLGACGLIGLTQAAQFVNRAKQLRQMIMAFERLETEISYGCTPLPLALKRMAQHMKPPLTTLFENVSKLLLSPQLYSTQEAWQKALIEDWHYTVLKQSEKDIVQQLGLSLGISDRLDQIKHLRLAVQQLQHEEVIARDEQYRYEKMYKSLGWLTGALIVILIY